MNSKILVSVRTSLLPVALSCLFATACGGVGADSGEGQETLGSASEQLTHSANGFVWSSQLTGSFTAVDAYSSASNNTITQLSTGRYRVDFPNIGAEVGGDVQVTAYGGSSERCKVESWSSSGSTLQAYVRCFTAAGVPANSLFTASYVGRAGVSGNQGGYVWADQPTATDYTPHTMYQWNSTGATNTIHRNGTGSYTVRFPFQSFTGGTVEVTAYGSGNQYCKVQSWGPSGSDQLVNVGCLTPNGVATDTTFTMVFSNLSPNGTPSYTYAWASDPNAASYTPSATYQRGFISGDGPANGGHVTSPQVSITHNSTGYYNVHFPQMTASGGGFGKSNVKVTGYGYDNTTCKVLSWGNSGDGASASVSCQDAAGNPANAYFTITYSTTQFIIG